jgi:hypothetical protein
MRKLGIVREQEAKPFRSRPNGLEDSPAETHSGLQGLPIAGTDGTIESAFSQVGTA